MLAVLASCAACGAGARPLTREEYGARVGALCSHMQQQLARRGGTASQGGLARQIQRGLPILEETVAHLHRLEPPPVEHPAAASWLHNYDAMLDVLRKTAEANQRGRPLSDADWWEELAPYAVQIQDGAWKLGAYGCAGAGATAPPKVVRIAYRRTVKQVVIDTDMGADDWLAILYLLQRRDVHVRAITIAGTGLAHCEPGMRNALGLLALTRTRRVPVACGPTWPLQGDHHFPAAWRRSADTLLGLSLPSPRSGKPSGGAAELLTSAIRSSPTPATLLTLGPLTNVAQAFGHSPQLAQQLGGLYIMGGAITARGNVPGTSAEWNFYVDPTAAATVLGTVAPVTLIPLDATRHVPLDRAFYEGIRAAHATPAARFVFDVLTRERAQIDSGTYDFWDPLAAGALTADVVTTQRRRLKIATQGAESGWTWAASDGVRVRMAVYAKRHLFEQTFLSVLNEHGTE
jgi:pyrimidine-specific ribonucleoside hydrolase